MPNKNCIFAICLSINNVYLWGRVEYDSDVILPVYTRHLYNKWVRSEGKCVTSSSCEATVLFTLTLCCELLEESLGSKINKLF